MNFPYRKAGIVMFRIPAAPRGIPIAWKGHYYVRDGEELSPLNLEETERVRKQIQHVDRSAVTCDEATIEDLDEIAIKVARDRRPVMIDHYTTKWCKRFSNFLNYYKVNMSTD